MLGEGVSSQVVLAADTFRPDAPPVAVKILKRQHSYAGQKASGLAIHPDMTAPCCALCPEICCCHDAAHCIGVRWQHLTCGISRRIWEVR